MININETEHIIESTSDVSELSISDKYVNKIVHDIRSLRTNRFNKSLYEINRIIKNIDKILKLNKTVNIEPIINEITEIQLTIDNLNINVHESIDIFVDRFVDSILRKIIIENVKTIVDITIVTDKNIIEPFKGKLLNNLTLAIILVIASKLLHVTMPLNNMKKLVLELYKDIKLSSNINPMLRERLDNIVIKSLPSFNDTVIRLYNKYIKILFTDIKILDKKIKNINSTLDYFFNVYTDIYRRKCKNHSNYNIYNTFYTYSKIRNISKHSSD